jgi:hypothetical protein
MNLESHRQWSATQRKLVVIEQQIEAARSRADTAENRESLESLVRMANQLREELTRFQSRQKRQAS